jgi:hypothetical protein
VREECAAGGAAKPPQQAHGSSAFLMPSRESQSGLVDGSDGHVPLCSMHSPTQLCRAKATAVGQENARDGCLGVLFHLPVS